MQRVLVLDRNREPLMPCHPARARQMLREGKAAVFRRYPFTIILKERAGGDVQPVAFKVDPGSRPTGVYLERHRLRVAAFTSLQDDGEGVTAKHRRFAFSEHLSGACRVARHQRLSIAI